MRTRGHIKVVNYFKKVGYRRLFWKDYDFTELNKIIYKKKPGKSSVSYSNAIMMFDKTYITYEQKKDAFLIKINKNNEIVNNLIKNMINMFKELSNDYPENIKIEEE